MYIVKKEAIQSFLKYLNRRSHFEDIKGNVNFSVGRK